MKRSAIYLAGAVILGILAMVAPLIAFAEFKHGGFTVTSPWIRSNLRELEGYDSLAAPNSDVPGFTILTVSFVVAMLAYLLVRRRIPRHGLPWVRMPPY